MRIAVTYENGQIFQHFGHTEQFKLYDVTDGKVTATQVVDTNGSGHGARLRRGRRDGAGRCGHPAVRRIFRRRGQRGGGSAGGDSFL